ncbi:MAG: APC family permease [candidate division Zixibacteria bacterium]|nr:APC family permease [candidate division Zixibacteria bacterium]
MSSQNSENDPPNPTPQAGSGGASDRDQPLPISRDDGGDLAAPDLSPPESTHWGSRLKRALIGGKRELHDTRVFHKVSLVAFLAWVGLGADGLSSSAYGPEEMFKALGPHQYLAPVLAVATALTVFIISYAYSRIIEHFPFGGGGYNVASRLLGSTAGVVSGSALIIDYMLTISISIAAGGDAVFSLAPPEWNHVLIFGLVRPKLLIEFLAIVLLVLLNLRGVKESVTVLTPIFITFLLTHVVLIAGAVLSRVHEVPAVVGDLSQGFNRGLLSPPVGLGIVGMLALLMRAYSMGGGTYTGIEAVSNGLMIMREPKVETGKRTMALMATSLALTAGGLVVAYLLLHAAPAPGKTMNAVLAEKFAGGFQWKGLHVGAGFVMLTLAAEAMLLFVAAQTGFIDGPRVMGNMATDSWLPHRFAQLSDRLTMQNGVLLMGMTSVLALLYTRGNVTHLVVMYSINVFLTFSLSQLSMCRFWLRDRAKHRDWVKHISVHVVGLVLCVTILSVTVYEKFGQGGWLTLLLTVILIGLCFWIRHHYRRVQGNVKQLDEILSALPLRGPEQARAVDPAVPTAALLVGSYSGLGVHALLAIQRHFPGHFRNFIFISVGVVDAATFKNLEAVGEVEAHTTASLQQYTNLAHRLGLAAGYRMEIGTEVVATGEELCHRVAREFPRVVFFAGKLIFEDERWFHRLLHNETALQLQRRLQFAGLNAMVLPVRVMRRAPLLPAH